MQKKKRFQRDKGVGSDAYVFSDQYHSQQRTHFHSAQPNVLEFSAFERMNGYFSCFFFLALSVAVYVRCNMPI